MPRDAKFLARGSEKLLRPSAHAMGLHLRTTAPLFFIFDTIQSDKMFEKRPGFFFRAIYVTCSKGRSLPNIPQFLEPQNPEEGKLIITKKLCFADFEALNGLDVLV